jgi:hypothetical protein
MNFNRKQFLKFVASSGAFLTFVPQSILNAVEISSLNELINKAGNSNNEKERAQYIFNALNDAAVSAEDKEILNRLFYVADRWANGYEKYSIPGSEGNESEGYLCGFFNSKCKIDRFLLPIVDEDNVFFPLLAFYRSRMLIAQQIQNGNILMVPENRNIYTKEGQRLMKFALKEYPENVIAQNYFGNYNVWGELVEEDSSAPLWANHQRMVLEKLTWLIHWWIDNRQISDGQFGGGWGDDVEMWRHWVPVLFAFNDEKAIESQEKLFEGLYSLSKMKKGYTTKMSDVEHTSEEYADPLTCMLNMQAENPVWEQRALQVLESIENLWTGKNERGYLQFKSTWFSVEEVDLNKKRACDSPYHTRLVQPLMLIWLRTGNERTARFLKSWLKTWVDATFTEEYGKPNGIVPAAIHWPEGAPAGTGKNWWQPENYHTPLYDYPSQQANMYECFLQAYFITKDEFYLKPMKFVADQRLKGLGELAPENYKSGSLDWSISKIKGDMVRVLMKYRVISGDRKYDSILKNEAEGYERYQFDHDLSQLTNSLDTVKESLTLPKELFTTEVRWTDRLFAFNKNYLNFILEKPHPSFNAATLFSTLTGSIGDFKILPVFGVKWLTPSTDIAILVEKNTGNNFEAQLFHFGNDSRKMGAKLYNLESGIYTVQLNEAFENEVEISNANNKIEFKLAPKTLSKLKIKLNA